MYNTGNPIGSTAPKDFSDNSEITDRYVNDAVNETTLDRFGRSRFTLHGIEKKADSVFASLGFFPPVDYTTGLTVDSRNFTVTYNGVVYAAQPSAVPFTTGAWDAAQWYPIQNILNQKNLLVFDTYAEASAAAATLPNGQKIEAPDADGRLSQFEVQEGNLANQSYMPDTIRLQSYTSLRTYSGLAHSVDIIASGVAGRFNLDTLDSNTPDNGGTVIVDASGRRWKRLYSGAISMQWFGIGTGLTDDKARISALFNEVSAKGGGEIEFDSDNDYLVSDAIIIPSNLTLRFTGSGYVKLTQSTTVGGVMFAFGTSSAPAENITIINPLIDAADFGYPKGSTYGENGIGGTKCRRVTVLGGIIKNCRRGSSNPVGTGGKAVQFEDGVDDILVDGLTAMDCTVAMETGGVVDVASPYDFRRSTGVQYKNIRAYRCERVISVQQTNSPPDTSPSVVLAQIDGVMAVNCGREAVVGTEKSFGAIVLDRASNVHISNVVIANDATYGTLGAVVRQASGTNCTIDVAFTGDCDALVLHGVGTTGFGTTGTCQDNSYRLSHKGTAGYVVSNASDGPELLENLYEAVTDVVTTGLVNVAAALSTLYMNLISGGKSVSVQGTALAVYAYLSNTYPEANWAAAGTIRFNGLQVSIAHGAQTISSTGTDALRLQYANANRLECNQAGVGITGIPSYADNAAATAGGLAEGQIYRTATGQLFVRY